jgi:hypothetical protein
MPVVKNSQGTYQVPKEELKGFMSVAPSDSKIVSMNDNAQPRQPVQPQRPSNENWHLRITNPQIVNQRGRQVYQHNNPYPTKTRVNNQTNQVDDNQPENDDNGNAVTPDNNGPIVQPDTTPVAPQTENIQDVENTPPPSYLQQPTQATPPAPIAQTNPLSNYQPITGQEAENQLQPQVTVAGQPAEPALTPLATQDNGLGNSLEQTTGKDAPSNEQLLQSQITSLQNQANQSKDIYAQAVLRQQVQDLQDKATQVASQRFDALTKNNPAALQSFGGLMNLRNLDPSYASAEAALGSLEESKKTIDQVARQNAGVGIASNILSGLKDAITGQYTYIPGQTIQAANALATLQAIQRQKQGKASYADNLALTSAAVKQAVDQSYGNQIGMSYNAGLTTGQSIPYMAEFLLNPGESVGDAVTKNLTNYVLKRFGSSAILKKVASTSARLIGDAVKAVGVEATFGMPRITADATQRATGNIQTKISPQGYTQYAGTQGGDNTVKAIGKSALNEFIQDYSEMFGEYFSPAGNAIKGAVGKMASSKVGKVLQLNKVADFLTAAKASELSQALSGFEKHAHWNGALGEYGEEVVGNVMNAATVGDQSWADVVDPKQNLNTFLSVALMSGFFSAVHSAGYFTGRRQARSLLNRSDINGFNVLGGDWQSFKTDIDNSDMDALKAYGDGIKNTDYLNQKEKAAILGYIGAKTFANGYNIADLKKKTEGDLDNNQMTGEASYDQGLTTTDPQEKADTKLRLQVVSDQVDTSKLDAMPGTPAQKIQALRDMGVSEDKVQAAINYFNLSAKYNGMIHAAQDNISQTVDANNQQIDGITHVDGNVYSATDRSDNPINVLSGKIGFDQNGEVDPKQSDDTVVIKDSDGQMQMVPISDISINSVEPSDAMKQRVGEGIYSQLSEQLADEINGKRDFQPGEQYSVLVSGKPMNVQVTQVTPDGIVFTDGHTSYISTPDQLNEYADAKSMQDIQAENEQQTKQVQQQEEQKNQQAEMATPDYWRGKVGETVNIGGKDYTINEGYESKDKNGKPASAFALYDENGQMYQKRPLTADNLADIVNNPPVEQPKEQKPATPKEVIDDLKSKMPADQVQTFIQNNIDSAQKKLTAAQNKKNTATDREKFLQNEQNKQSDINNAQAELNYYQSLMNEVQPQQKETQSKDAQSKEVDYTSMAPDEAVYDMRGKGLSDEVIKNYADGQRSLLKEDLANLKKQEPKISEAPKLNRGESPLDFNARYQAWQEDYEKRHDAWQKQVDDLKQKSGAWNSISNYKEDVNKSIADINKELGESVSPEDEVYRALSQGHLLRWSDKNGDKGLGSELGMSEDERRKRISLLSNEGYTPSGLAQYLKENDDEHAFDNVSEQDIRNMIIDAVRTNNSTREMINASQKLHDQTNTKSEEINNLASELGITPKELEPMYDELLQKASEDGVSPKDYYLYKDKADVLGTDVKDYVSYIGYLDSELDALTPEQHDDILNEIDNEYNRIREELPEGQGSDASNERSSEVLQGTEHSDNQGQERGTESTEPVSTKPNEEVTPVDLVNAYHDGKNIEETEKKISDFINSSSDLDTLQTTLRMARKDEKRRGWPKEYKKANKFIADEAEKRINELEHPNESQIKDVRGDVDTNPTDAQKEAGNYKKGHVKIDGMDVTIENPAGSVRRGVSEDGKVWKTSMHNDYGYIRGTTGVDGDHVDVYFSSHPDSGNVYVVDQVNPKTGEFDEHKVMYGFDSKDDAEKAYLSNYGKGWKGLGNITEVSKEDFKKWLDSSKRKTKAFADYKSINPIPVMTEEEYLSSKGAGYDFGDSAIHKGKQKTENQQDKIIDIQNEKDKDLQIRRDELRKEYQNKVNNGEIRNPTPVEQLIKSANGNLDNESTKAARRSLEKRGIDYNKNNENDRVSESVSQGKFGKSQEISRGSEEPEDRLGRGNSETSKDASGFIRGRGESQEEINPSPSDKESKVPDYAKAKFMDGTIVSGKVVGSTKNGITIESNGRSYTVSNDKILERSDKPINVDDNNLYRESEIQSKQLTDQVDSSVKSIAESLNTPIKQVTNEDDLTDRQKMAKGWFNTKTGEVVVNMDNADSPEDAQRTILHETVGHYGLRNLLGNNFTHLLDSVWKNDAIRNSIIERFRNSGGDFTKFDQDREVDEYMARMAENTTDHNLWHYVCDQVRSAIANAKIKLGFRLSDNDIRSLIQASYSKLKNGKIDLTYSPEKILYRGKDANEVSHRTATRMYEQIVGDKWFRLGREAFVDNMASLKVLIDSVLKERNEKLQEWEDPYTAENHVSSINKVENEMFNETYMKPIFKAVADMQKTGMTYNQIVNYLIEKHGLERNIIQSFRDAVEGERNQLLLDALSKGDNSKETKDKIDSLINGKYDSLYKFRDELEKSDKDLYKKNQELKDFAANLVPEFEYKDRSGISSIFKNEEDEENNEDGTWEDKALDSVNDIESSYDTKTLWDYINDATKKTLEKAFKSGTISKSQYNNTKRMFVNYIPLRGFKEDVASDVYEYFDDRPQNFAIGTIKAARGRVSLADDPLATIGAVGQRTISDGNRNLVNQKLYNFAVNHPSKLLGADRMWYINTGTKQKPVWKESYPDIPEKSTADQATKIRDEWLNEMRQKQEEGTATQRPNGIDLKYVATNNEKSQHDVQVRLNGESYTVHVNGNPRAAQALNGMIRNSSDWVPRKILRYIMGHMAMFFTTANPAFVVRNLAKDMEFASNAVFVKESSSYFKRWMENAAIGGLNQSLGIVTAGYAGGDMKIVSLMRKFQNNKLDINDPMEKYFHEFMTNGGETGYTNINTIEEYKGIIDKEIKKLTRSKGKDITMKPVDLLNIVGNGIELANRCAEDVTRFNTYLTSRQMGRSIITSVSDAKNITVNFNKKGSGFGLAGWCQDTMLFFNAGVQSLKLQKDLWDASKFKFMLDKSFLVALGACAPIISKLIINGAGSGDDSEYDNIPSWIRENDLTISLPFGKSVSIPISIEDRSFYGLGEKLYHIVNHTYDKTPEEGALDILGQFLDVLPVNMLQGNNDASLKGMGMALLVPDVVKPIAQVMVNKDYFGKKIHKDSYNDLEPEYTKVYSGTNKELVNASKILNNITGGNAHHGGYININPADFEHIFTGYLGGTFSTINQAVKTALMINDPSQRQYRNLPIVSSFLQSPSDDMNQFGAVNERFYDINDKMKDVKNQISGFSKEEEKGIIDSSKELTKIYNSKNYKMYEVYQDWEKTLDSDRKALKDATSDSDRKMYELSYNMDKASFLKDIDKIK